MKYCGQYNARPGALTGLSTRGGANGQLGEDVTSCHKTGKEARAGLAAVNCYKEGNKISPGSGETAVCNQREEGGE